MTKKKKKKSKIKKIKFRVASHKSYEIDTKLQMNLVSEEQIEDNK